MVGTPIAESLGFALKILETEVQVVPASVVPFNYAISKIREVILSLPATGVAAAFVQPVPVSSNSPLPQLHGVAIPKAGIPQIASPSPLPSGINGNNYTPAPTAFNNNVSAPPSAINNRVTSAPSLAVSKPPVVVAQQPQPQSQPQLKPQPQPQPQPQLKPQPTPVKKEGNEKQDAIRSQMEFYFSDANLAKDRFLKTLIDASPDGWVHLNVFEKFNRLKQIGMTSLDDIVGSMGESTLLEINAEKTQIRRKVPLHVKEVNADTDQRTIYAENIPRLSDHDLLKQIFGKCGEIVYISLPRHAIDNRIKGFAFIEYKTKEAAERAVDEFKEHPYTHQFGNRTVSIRVISKMEWLANRKAEKVVPKAGTLAGVAAGHQGAVLTPSVVIHFSNVGKNVSRMSARLAFEIYGPVAYIDFTNGQPEGYARYRNAEDAKKAVELQATNPIELPKGRVVTLRLLQGEEERHYWEKLQREKEITNNVKSKIPKGPRRFAGEPDKMETTTDEANKKQEESNSVAMETEQQNKSEEDGGDEKKSKKKRRRSETTNEKAEGEEGAKEEKEKSKKKKKSKEPKDEEKKKKKKKSSE